MARLLLLALPLALVLGCSPDAAAPKDIPPPPGNPAKGGGPTPALPRLPSK